MGLGLPLFQASYASRSRRSALLSLPTPLFAYRRLLANSLGDRAVELAPPEIHTLRVATRHRGYTHTVFTFFADAVADLIRPFIAEPAHAQTAPL
jgi:hypothetical protein